MMCTTNVSQYKLKILLAASVYVLAGRFAICAIIISTVLHLDAAAVHSP